MSGDTTTPMPDEAIEAAARAMFESAYPHLSWDSASRWQRAHWSETARTALAAAAPALLAAERERIAQAIEAVDPIEWALFGQFAGQEAARIVRYIP